MDMLACAFPLVRTASYIYLVVLRPVYHTLCIAEQGAASYDLLSNCLRVGYISTHSGMAGMLSGQAQQFMDT